VPPPLHRHGRFEPPFKHSALDHMFSFSDAALALKKQEKLYWLSAHLLKKHLNHIHLEKGQLHIRF
jgi:hypothetical protein